MQQLNIHFGTALNDTVETLVVDAELRILLEKGREDDLETGYPPIWRSQISARLPSRSGPHLVTTTSAGPESAAPIAFSEQDTLLLKRLGTTLRPLLAQLAE
ncbi:hypothetical protein, partial [Acidithiobacillus thiooxidans]